MTVHLWVPSGLRRRRNFDDLAYVVVDELDEDLIGLTLTPWPTVDEVGRLHFDVERSSEVGARKQVLVEFLAQHRIPAKMADRALRMGDTFAVKVRSAPRDGELADPATWMIPPVIDVSPDAREAAKVAFYSAVAPFSARNTDDEVLRLARPSAPLRSVAATAPPRSFTQR